MPSTIERDALRLVYGGKNCHPAGPLFSGPMLGETSETKARIWVQAAAPIPLTLTVKGPFGTRTVTATPRKEDWLVHVFEVDGLTPGAVCSYSVSSDLGKTPEHTFRTAMSPSARKVRIAFGSCFYYYDRQSAIFDSIGAQKPDLWVMAGDNCYYLQPDWANEHTKMLAQLRNRNHPGIQRLLAETPTLAVWDDHDYGPNDADSRYSGRAESLRVFRRSWAQPPGGAPGAEGIFFSKRLGPVEIFFLDMRSFRIGRSRILGDAQLGWLLKGLRASTAPVKLIVSGSQVLPDAPAAKDWECFRRDGPSEVDALLDAIKIQDIRGVVMASGDVHIGYLLHRAGQPIGNGLVSADLWELTSSPLANDIWHEQLVTHGAYDPSILREVGACNFGLIDVNLDRPGKEIVLRLMGERGNVLVSQTAKLSDLARHPARSKWVPLVWPDGKIYFFKGDRYLQVCSGKGQIEPGYPKPIVPSWRGLYREGIDAAFASRNGKAYFFCGNGYIAYNISTDSAEPGPRYLARYWRGVWPEGVDAAVHWNNSKAYLFRGPEYIRYDMAADRADPGYPKTIASGWRGVWPEGIDAAALMPDGDAYFFRGDQHIRYDVAKDCPYSGYPRPNADRFPGLFVG